MEPIPSIYRLRTAAVGKYGRICAVIGPPTYYVRFIILGSSYGSEGPFGLHRNQGPGGGGGGLVLEIAVIDMVPLGRKGE